MSRARRNAVAFGLGAAAGFSLMMAACSGEASQETAARELAADPDRLATVQQRCRDGSIGAHDARCSEAAEAERRRFQGDGVPYTPGGRAPAATPTTR